jgi:hypothetical protein
MMVFARLRMPALWNADRTVSSAGLAVCESSVSERFGGPRGPGPPDEDGPNPLRACLGCMAVSASPRAYAEPREEPASYPAVSDDWRGRRSEREGREGVPPLAPFMGALLGVVGRDGRLIWSGRV